MDFNQFVITTVQPDAKATMRGSQGQKPRKKKRLDQPPASGAFAQEHQVTATEDLSERLAQAAEATPHRDGVDAWAEVSCLDPLLSQSSPSATRSTEFVPPQWIADVTNKGTRHERR
jgi:hypothetical protein